MEQTKNESSQTIKHTSVNENNSLLKPTEENVSAVEKQTLSSLPLTTSEVAGENIGKVLREEISTIFLKNQDTQKTNTDSYAPTATFQWVCMDIVRIIKVQYNGKEYDFEQLSDGSLIWNEELKPFIEPKPLNVAENVLKYGTGGINIDESRVESSQDDKEMMDKKASKNPTTNYSASENKIYSAFAEDRASPSNNLGRFPANLIHDNSEEVRECFPETKSGKAGIRTSDGFNDGVYGKGMGIKAGQDNGEFGDSGNASRFFKSIIYQAKASKSERNKWLDSTLTVKYNGSICKEEAAVAVQLLQRVISEQEIVSFSTGESGESITGQCHRDSLSIILTKTKRIIGLKIYSSLMLSLTSDSTQVANSEMEAGGNLAESVADLKRWILTTTKGNQELALGASRAVCEMLQTISVEENWKPSTNFHATVKPIALMEYLIKMVTPKGGTVLDPFMGSGSTGVAAKNLGMSFVGIDMSEEYIKIAEARIAAIKQDLTLF